MTGPSLRLLSLPNQRTANDSASLEPPDVPLRGSLAVVSALDIVQLLCTNGQSWMIQFSIRDVSASITIAAGQLLHAQCGTQTGEAALIDILGWTGGSFHLQPVAGKIACTLRGDWRVTLLRAVQALDEKRRPHQGCVGSRPPAAADLAMVPAQRHRLVDSWAGDCAESAAARAADGRGKGDFAGRRVAGPSLPDSIHAQPSASMRQHPVAAYLVDLGFAALRAGNPSEARHHWERALLCDPGNRTIMLNLRRLEQKTRQ